MANCLSGYNQSVIVLQWELIQYGTHIFWLCACSSVAYSLTLPMFSTVGHTTQHSVPNHSNTLSCNLCSRVVFTRITIWAKCNGVCFHFYVRNTVISCALFSLTRVRFYLFCIAYCVGVIFMSCFAFADGLQISCGSCQFLDVSGLLWSVSVLRLLILRIVIISKTYARCAVQYIRYWFIYSLCTCIVL